MNITSVAYNRQAGGDAFGHAIVIGGSIAGLTLARVLADHFGRVTVIERDDLPEKPEFRAGAPQAHHTHFLLPQGQTILEGWFPGILAELEARGATPVRHDRDQCLFIGETWYDDIEVLSCSRPLFENLIYRRLVGYPNVRLIQQQEVLQLCVDERGRRVIGIGLRHRSSASHQTTYVPADLVVDASGRGSQAPQWLASLGYTSPEETIINAFSGYTSRIYRRAPGFNEAWKIMRIKRTPPDQTRGGMIAPLEGGRWHVTLVGMARDYPPTDEAGFLAFARSLPSRQLYEAIQEAEPITKIYGYRGTQNRLHHYDRLPRYLEGFLTGGDAVCALSPMYAQGMTAALLGSQALANCLMEQRGRGTLAGLAPIFQQHLRQAIDPIWQMVTESDRMWPATEVTEKTAARRQLPKRRTPSSTINYQLIISN